MLNRDDLNGPTTAASTEDTDSGSAVHMEFVCGSMHGWVDVQDGTFGKKVEVWLYGHPTNVKVASWKAD